MSYVTDDIDDKVVRLLKVGGIGVLPTDTIYGLSCRAMDKVAVKKAHKLKDRSQKPFVILISNTAQLDELGIISTDAAPALRYWPGKLTMVCGAKKAPAWLHMGTQSLAVRQPDLPGLRELISKTGPIISTSANKEGQKPAATIAEAKKYFGEELDFYVDAGKLISRPSTIVKESFGQLEVLRQGAVRIS